MAGESREGQAPAMSSEGDTYPSIHNQSNTFSTLQMPHLAEPMVSLTTQFIPLTSVSHVVTSQVGSSPDIASPILTAQPLSLQTGLTLHDEALIRNYMSQIQGLTVLQTEQGSSEPATSSSTELTTRQVKMASPHLTTLTPTQLLQVSSPHLLPMSSTCVEATASSNLMSTEISSSQLQSMITGQSPNLIQRQLTAPTPSDAQLNPLRTEQETMTPSLIASPLETLVQPTTNGQSLLEEATREIREDAICKALQEGSDGTFPESFDKAEDRLNVEIETASSSLLNQDYSESLTSEWSKLFTEQITPYFGYVNTLEEAEQLLKMYEVCTNSKFLGVKKCDKTNFEVDVSRGRPFRYTALVICGHKLCFDGVPYYHGGKALYYCHHGSKRKELPKDRPLKHPKKRMQSKKVGCMARVAFRVVARFPEHKLKDNTEYNRLVASQTLSKKLKEGANDVTVEWRVYVMLPKAAAHTNHEIIPTLRLREGPLDRRVIGKICQLVTMGLRDTTTIHRQVVHFAENVLKKEGMEWKATKDICTSRQVWWYRKQVLDLLRRNAFEGSKFMEMIQEVGQISQKHQYTGYVNKVEQSGCGDGTHVTGGKWKKRTDLKNKKNYEKQLNNLKGESFTELALITKNLQSCTQVEVLARLLLSLRTARETFEKEMNLVAQSKSNGCFEIIQAEDLHFMPCVSQIVEVQQSTGSDIEGDDTILQSTVHIVGDLVNGKQFFES